MSKGTRVYPVRIPGDLMEDVELAIESRNQWSMEESWSLSDFIRIALREKVSKMIRSRKKYKKRKPTLGTVWS